jgi:hypothetical protein
VRLPTAFTLLVALACHPVLEPPEAVDPLVPLEARELLYTAPGLRVDAPHLSLVQGEGMVALWLDRPLGPGERIERLDERTGWETLGVQGRRWVDPSPARFYRWSGPGDSAPARARSGELILEAPDWPLLYLSGEAVMRSLSWAGPSLGPLDLGVTIRRARDGAWLVADGGEPVWSEDEGVWASPEPEQLLAGVELSWYTEAREPSLEAFTLGLVVLHEGEIWPLAHGETSTLELGRSLAWGDLHSHSNLSFDGCEDPDDHCLPRGESPGLDLFLQAEEQGLDFAALTDHADHQSWTDLEQDLRLDTWEESLRLAQQAEGGPVLPILGYEWTGGYEHLDVERAGGHRTVLFEELDPCEHYWVGAGDRPTAKDVWGLERYGLRGRSRNNPVDFIDAMREVEELCEPRRWLSWFHHPALSTPRGVDWSLDINQDLGDRVVEIYSEHGASECAEHEGDCAWQANEIHHNPAGAVQVALQHGLALGFLGSTDNHEARPGSLADGPGPIAAYHDIDGDGIFEPYLTHGSPGSVSGVLYAGDTLSRPALFDAIEARNTVASSWIFEEVRIAALGQDGQLYLPGSDVPPEATPLRVVAELSDPIVDSWRIQILDPWNEPHVEVHDSQLDVDLDLLPGEVRYLRVSAWVGDEELRLWASPFFGVD